MPKITTFLAFEDRAEEAAAFYVSIFKNSKILKTVRYVEGGPGPKGSVMTVLFQLEGQEYVAMNGGSHFKFTDGMSLSVGCNTQQEIDEYSAKLCAGGGKQGPCGWITDKFGVSWQVNPNAIGEMLDESHPAKAKRVMDALMAMNKIDLEALKRAYLGR